MHNKILMKEILKKRERLNGMILFGLIFIIKILKSFKISNPNKFKLRDQIAMIVAQNQVQMNQILIVVKV